MQHLGDDSLVDEHLPIRRTTRFVKQPEADWSSTDVETIKAMMEMTRPADEAYQLEIALGWLKKQPERRRSMKTMATITDSYNAFVGAVIAILTMVLGEHWYIFAAFLLLNVIDWITGWMKSRINGVENSMAGWKGVLKKLGYWLMIAVAFAIAAALIEVGKVIGIDLGITTLAWMVRAGITHRQRGRRSIVENFVEAGYDVPKILTTGLQVADEKLNGADKEEEE